MLDQRLPSLTGVEVVRAIDRDSLPTRVVMLSASSSNRLVVAAVKLGVAGFLTKVATLAEICDTVAAVARGETVLAQEVQSGLVSELRERGERDHPLLTERESQILRLVADGLSGPQIGVRLFISSSTVKTHVKSIFEKLGVTDRAAAVAAAMRRGLLE